MSENPTSPKTYRDRTHAGAVLAEETQGLLSRDALVLGLPRGGVVVAAEMASRLSLELDVLVVRKLPIPGREQEAMGAVGTGGICILDEDVAQQAGIDDREREALIADQKRRVQKTRRAYRGDVPVSPVEGREVCLVDDGLRTGWTMSAAVRIAQRLKPSRVFVAVPVAPLDVCRQLEQSVDGIVCPQCPEGYMSVSQWYDDFPEVIDDEVCEVLRRTDEAAADPDRT